MVAYYNEIDPTRPNGYVTLSTPAILRRASWIPAQLRMSPQMTLKDSHKFTSSPELRGGRSRYVAQDGLITDPSGQVHAPASLSAQQAKAADLLMSGTYGPPCIGWSGSAALSSSLASNLAALTLTTGSTLYRLTWKQWAMHSGRSRFRLRASVPRTGVTALIGWPTPTASNVKNAYQDADRVIARKAAGRQSNLQDFAALTGWTTPSASDGRRGGTGITEGMSGSSLVQMAKMAGWPTPTATDHKGVIRAGECARASYQRIAWIWLCR